MITRTLAYTMECTRLMPMEVMNYFFVHSVMCLKFVVLCWV
jgi:hypothetical protein